MATFIKLPSPTELAQKETLKSVSLRVKQSTYDVFEGLANKEESSASAMMINLLDYYAQTCRETQFASKGALSIEVMQKHLDKLAKTIGSMSDDDRLTRLLNAGIPDLASINGLDDDDLSYLATTAKNYQKGIQRPDDVNPVALMSNDLMGSYSIDIGAVCRGDKPYFEDVDNEGFVYIPADKWALTVLMLDSYGKRAHELRPEIKVLYTEALARAIFDAAIKNKDGAEYAKKLAEILLDSWKGQNENAD